MALKEYYGLVGRLVSNIDNSSPLIPVPAAFSGAIVFSGFSPGDTSYFALSAGGLTEVVKLVGVEENYLVVERGSCGTISYAFPTGTTIEYQVTTEGILHAINIDTNVSIEGKGLVEVIENSPNDFSVGVEAPDIKGEGGISVFGSWPAIRIGYESPEGNCSAPSVDVQGGITDLVGEGLVTAFVNGGVGTVRVRPLVLNAGTNIQISGAWPNYTITATAGSGTVGSVGVGAGLSLTGSPNVNPTIFMQNTGVAAGTYGGVAINSRGQITAVPPTFNPVSVISAGSNTTVSRAGDTVTISVPNADIGQRGAVELADETDPFNPNDNTTAATPAVVAQAIATIPEATISGVTSIGAEAPALYSNIINSTSQTLTLGTGDKALVTANATMLDTLEPTSPVEFGIAVLNANTLVQGDRILKQSQQSITFVVDGPFSGTLALATTTPPAGSSLTGYSLTILVT